LILEYYPDLSAEQVKYCIEKSAVVPPFSLKVIEPGTNKETRSQNFPKQVAL
jgi:hypothetical protein